MGGIAMADPNYPGRGAPHYRRVLDEHGRRRAVAHSAFGLLTDWLISSGGVVVEDDVARSERRDLLMAWSDAHKGDAGAVVAALRGAAVAARGTIVVVVRYFYF